MNSGVAYFDSHAHLGLLTHSPVPEIMQRAQQASVLELVTVSTSGESWASNALYAHTYPRTYYSIGIHPHESHTYSQWADEFDKHLAQHPARHKCVAVGEMGLDYSGKNDHSRASQHAAFLGQLETANKWNLPLIVHCRDAFTDLYALLEKAGMPKAQGVLHCFTGTLPEAQRGIEMGFFVSFSGIVTFKNAESLKHVALQLPSDRILIETDCPYLAPVPFRGKPNEPSLVTHTAHFLALARKEPLEVFARQCLANTRKLFQITADPDPIQDLKPSQRPGCAGGDTLTHKVV